ncbi:UNKNOWN [Stylonychia lemnae]|uniref:Uncharacterized protein n=1 Tax=Stylonychia lemnae TaxID=5949 RepID=A0A077ZX86_STYLE|nr:UNKNOWN [Stylonychia lemnae]|eukprot:CDW73852.1 UNKNOWN [Stylonychia lemnae]
MNYKIKINNDFQTLLQLNQSIDGQYKNPQYLPSIQDRHARNENGFLNNKIQVSKPNYNQNSKGIVSPQKYTFNNLSSLESLPYINNSGYAENQQAQRQDNPSQMGGKNKEYDDLKLNLERYNDLKREIKKLQRT